MTVLTYTVAIILVLLVFFIETSAEQLLKLDRHHRAYEVSVDMSACRYEPCSVDEERYKFAGGGFDRLGCSFLFEKGRSVCRSVL
jgi:hypothetical protein